MIIIIQNFREDYMINLFKRKQKPINYELTYNDNNDKINFTLDNNKIYITKENFDICLSDDLLTDMLYKVSKKSEIVII